MKLVMGPLESSLNKHSFERLRQIRALLDNDTKLCIHRATNNFNAINLIREGRFSFVYIAKFDSRRVIAVKRLKSLREDDVIERLDELQFQRQLHRKNILPLLGYSINYQEVTLVMEFMGNDTLYDQLHRGHSIHFLSWFQRIKVALDIARGVEYLHVSIDLLIIHRDVKTTNVLLDDNYTAKLADFGLSIEAEDPVLQGVIVAGTKGYLCPDYLRKKELTTKCDVYGFGIVLLELLMGHRAFFKDDNGRNYTLVDMELGCESQIDFLDKRMPLPKGLVMEASMLVRELARECLRSECWKRPSMSRFVRRLEGILKLLQAGEENTGS